MEPDRPRGQQQRLAGALVALLTVSGLWVHAADLKPATIAAFDRYRLVVETAIDADASTPGGYLRVLTAGGAGAGGENRLRLGQVVIEALETTDHGRRIGVPDGLIHHWVGAVFVPGVHLDAAVALMQDYDHHAQVFKPNVAASKVLERDGDRFRVYLRFSMKKVIAVTVNTESSAVFTRDGPDRVRSAIRSTRVAEVEDPGTPREHELPVGQDGGYLWRLNTYWRFLERDGGTYVECESLTLTRGIPFGFGWLIGPFVTSVPKETLTNALTVTRRALLAPGGPLSLGAREQIEQRLGLLE